MNTRKKNLSGDEYNYEPISWTKTENSHNCYAYAFNQHKDNKINYPQMGKFGVIDFTKHYNEDRDFGCSPYEYRILSDNPQVYKVKEGVPCKKGYYKTYFVVAPNKDFHWYRQDRNGIYSHKPGQLKIRNTDYSNKKIKNPIYANRSNIPSNNNKTNNEIIDYSIVCNTFCVPKNNIFIE